MTDFKFVVSSKMLLFSIAYLRLARGPYVRLSAKGFVNGKYIIAFPDNFFEPLSVDSDYRQDEFNAKIDVRKINMLHGVLWNISEQPITVTIEPTGNIYISTIAI